MTMTEGLKKPSWLRRRKGEEPMDEFIPPPPVATIPPPASPSPQVAIDADDPQPHDMTLQEMVEAIKKYRKDKAQWTQLASESMIRIKDLVREAEFLRLELEQSRNNTQTLQSTIYDLQQKNADLRALQSEQYALAMHLVARYEHNEIPLNIRQKKKSGNGDKPKVSDLNKAANPLDVIDRIAQS